MISGYGLSAVFFSSIAGWFFPGDTSLLLLVLALGTSLPMIMGFFLIRPIPLPAHQGYDIVGDPDEAIRRDSSHERDYDFIEPSHPYCVQHDEDPDRQGLTYRRLPEEIQLDASVEELPSLPRRSMRQGAAVSLDLLPNVHGRRLFWNGDFWLLFTILSIRESSCFVPFHPGLIEQ